MSKKTSINTGNYRVSTGDWWGTVVVNHDIFDDPYVEACTQAIEHKVFRMEFDDDLNVNPVMMCRNTDKINDRERYINTYKILLNAGMPGRAELLRKVFMETIEVDLATEPLSASLKKL